MNSKIKIAYWLNALDLGGTTKTAYLFAKYLDKSKYNIVFFTYEDADLTRLDQFKYNAGAVRLIDRKNPKFGILSEFDIVHSFRAGHHEKPEPGEDFDGSVFIETNVFGFLDSNPRIKKSLFMSKWLMDYSLKGITFYDGHPWQNRFDWINNPIQPRYSNSQYWKIDDIIYLGHISRPDPGLFDGLSTQAVEILIKKGYNIKVLTMAPPSNMIEDLKKRNIPYHVYEPTIDWSGISSFYDSIDILLHDRVDGETFGNCIAEAQIHGKPVVTCLSEPKYPGMGCFQNQLQLVDHGVNGFHAKRDPKDYADKIEQLITNDLLRKTFGIRAKEKALKEYEVSVGVKKLEKIYQEVINKIENNN